MPIVEPVKVDNESIPGLYQKVPTEGDLHRFASAETGKAQFVSAADDSGRVAPGSGYLDVTLDFDYLVGVNQLQVGIADPTTAKVSFIPSLTTVNTALASAGGGTFPTSFTPTSASLLYFEEISTSVVRVHHVAADAVMYFFVAQTATPAENRQRVIVLNQGDNVAVEMLGSGDGILLKSPSGRRGLLRLTDALNLNVQPR